MFCQFETGFKTGKGLMNANYTKHIALYITTYSFATKCVLLT